MVQKPGTEMDEVEALEAYLSAHPIEFTRTATSKILCSSTGMEFPPSVTPQILQSYLTGRSYRRHLRNLQNQDYDFSQHSPHIVPHSIKKGKDGRCTFLFCRLTRKTLPRDRGVLEKHVGGRKYRRLLKEWEVNKEEEAVRREREEEKVRRRKEHGMKLLKERKERERENGMEDEEGIGEDGDGQGNDEEMGDEEGKEDSEMEIQEEEGALSDELEKDAFWTTGPSPFSDIDESEDEGEQNGKEKNRIESGSKSKRNSTSKLKQQAKKKQNAKQPQRNANSMGAEDQTSVGVKRKRDNERVIKKARQQKTKKKA